MKVKVFKCLSTLMFVFIQQVKFFNLDEFLMTVTLFSLIRSLFSGLLIEIGICKED